ncbi:MAG TPA: carbohydrate porin [Pseudolabrys sp.]|nr:carbohydrate porin [Pseudolabrys sp.]
MPFISFRAFAFAVCIALGAHAALADEDDQPDKNGVTKDSIAHGLPDNGDPGGVRANLAKYGITYGWTFTGEIFGNASGGTRRETIFEDRFDAHVKADLEKLIGAKGLSFYVSGTQTGGSGGLRRDAVPALATLSNIEALPALRLFELYLEQKFADDKASLRVGQFAADTEFFVSDWSDIFFTSGWPSILNDDLPSSGPSWPLATPGARLKIEPNKNFALLAGLFNGDPAGPGAGDPQARDHSGLLFRLRDPPFLIGEMQYKYNQDSGLAGTAKLGAWHHFGDFDDRRFDTNGLSLADPLSNGMPAQRRGDSGIYAVLDQQIYRPRGGDANKGIGLFGRVSASPSDRNLIDFYADGGIVFSGMVPSRADDKFGATFIYSHVSDAASALDNDRISFSGVPQPVRSHEFIVELSYQAQVMQGWTVQPDFQYVVRPGGNIPDPTTPMTAIKNAAIFGLRTTIKY